MSTTMTAATPTTGEGGLRLWHIFVVVGLAGATAAVILARDTRVESLVMVSLTAFAAIAAGVGFHQTLLPFGGADVSEESPVLSARAKAALEREKMLALRTIKELEFDRAMGKIADADFNEMVGRLRARAIGIMKQLDIESEGYRGLIERDLKVRLESAGVTPPAAGATVSQGKTAASTSGAPAGSTLACAACGTSNDNDARFCKKCGAKLDAFAVSM